MTVTSITVLMNIIIISIVIAVVIESVILMMTVIMSNQPSWPSYLVDCMQVAPLRIRPADVADLQKLFVRDIAKSRGQGSLTLTPEAVLQLESYSFPGNIKV